MGKIYYQNKKGDVIVGDNAIPSKKDKTLAEAIIEEAKRKGLIDGGSGQKGEKGDKGDKGDRGPAGP